MASQYGAVGIADAARVIVIKRRIPVVQELMQAGRRKHEFRSYHRTQMKKDIIVQKLRKCGCRITKQRLILLDIILEEECSCCKEIYYKAMKKDTRIGTATVYRMINVLEEIGAISRKNMYRIACGEVCEIEDACRVELDDDTVYHLSAKKWNNVIVSGLKACGYMTQQRLRSVVIKQCPYEDRI
jgi:Fur family ferric uptake transcriptional regulator